MMKRFFCLGSLFLLCSQAEVHAHCQLPCGIYHDDMVFDQIDQYVETMVKAVTVLNDSKFATTAERNTFVRWVMQKDKQSDEISELFNYYFLQQKIKPGEEDTVKRLTSLHKLVFLTVKIKQTVDINIVNDFYEEWERFKLMFHVEGYACKMEQAKLKQLAEKKAKEQEKLKNGQTPYHEHDDHDHDHDHDDDHHDHSH